MARDYADVLNGTFGDEENSRAGRDMSAIFGSAIRLADDSDRRTQRRIVIYPCACDDADSETAQGLMCALTWMLNALDGVFVMPLLVDAPTDAWTPDDSSFRSEEFDLEELGEDTVVTAVFSRADGQLKLAVSAETEIEDTEDLAYEITGGSLSDLLGALLESAGKFAVWLDGYESDAMTFGHTIKADGAQIEAWLKAAFALHRAMLWDAVNETETPLDFDPGTATAFSREFAVIQAKTVEIAQDATTWLLAQAITLATVWYKQVDPEGLVEMVQSLNHWQIAAPALSRPLIEMGSTRLASEVLETAVEEAPEIAFNWLVLARLYAAAQRGDLMIDVLQRSLEQHDDNPALLMLYGDTALSYADQGMSFKETILLDETEEHPTTEKEAVTAFEDAVRLTSGDQHGMASVQLVSALARFTPEKIWPAFEVLAVSDSTGMYTELAINAVAAQEDIEKSLGGLEKAAAQYPTVGQVWRNLAYVQYLSGDTDSASVSVKKALEFVKDLKTRGEYELLSLYTQDTAIESQLAETADLVSAGAEITDRMLEFLEWIVTEAPHYAEGYLLLARAYSLDGEDETALEVMLDAEKNVGTDSGILVAIIDLLIASGEESVSLDYITKGLEEFPRHIPLLARAAQVTHALGDEDGARAFLRQAHNIAPYHKELLRVTREILAGGVESDDDFDDEDGN